MLKLTDFFHLPLVEALFARITAGGPGLVLVAGLGTSEAATQQGYLASGHMMLLRLLMRECLSAHRALSCTIIAPDRDTIRAPREARSRVVTRVIGSRSASDHLAAASVDGTGLIVLDQLHPEALLPALEAARAGAWILTAMDTALAGEELIRYLGEQGATPDHLSGLAWVIGVERVPTLCPSCKTRRVLSADEKAWLRDRWPHGHLPLPEEFQVCQATGCDQCRQAGMMGEATIFDILHVAPQVAPHVRQANRLSAETYALLLAAQGTIALEDAQQYQSLRYRRLNDLLSAHMAMLDRTTRHMDRKVAELENANRVLEQRTRALITLQDIVHSLTDTTGIDALMARICRDARLLCEADRAILYARRADGQAEIRAVHGWPTLTPGQVIDPSLVFSAETERQAAPFTRVPPGLESVGDPTLLRRGVAVPLRTQTDSLGLLLIHASQPTVRFSPGNMAMLQALADQAALALQFASLIASRTQQERVERELELARQVQQSVLPRHFPEIAGCTFAACNEPARQVGGDFYDVIALDEDHFGLAIADVSGKGIPAALFMALTRSLLRAEAYHHVRAPRAMLARINDLLHDLGQPDMFVTVFYGVVHRPTRRMVYARAGHERPVLLRAGAVHELPGHGAALGFFERERLRITEEQIDLLPGDKLVLYTDGLTDVPNPAGELFDRARLLDLVAGYALLPPDDLCTAIYRELAAYQGSAEQFDDMTLLVMALH